ncbi:MAG: RNA polymerase sigma factor [Acutalibacteraceae bacterium]|jgi:RNA polymerase sigma factor (sigma-70 family)
MLDEEIVALYWQRDEAAIIETQARYERYLIRVAFNILANDEDSRESVNDTYLAAWESMPPHRPQVLSTFLGKLTRRIAIDRYRHRHRQKRQGSEYALSLDELGECVSGREDPERELDDRALGEALSAFVRALPDTARRVFIGRYYYLDPLREVAAYCGVSESAAKSLLFRVRGQLKEYLRKEGIEI